MLELKIPIKGDKQGRIFIPKRIRDQIEGPLYLDYQEAQKGYMLRPKELLDEEDQKRLFWDKVKFDKQHRINPSQIDKRCFIEGDLYLILQKKGVLVISQEDYNRQNKA